MFVFNNAQKNDYVRLGENVFEFEPLNIFEVKEFIKHIDTTVAVWLYRGS